MKSQLLDLSFHIRHNNKKIKEITNQTRKEVRNESLPSKVHKAHLKMLMSVLNTLPAEEQANYTSIKSMIASDSPKPKENNFEYKTQTSVKKPEVSSKVSEIPYKKYIELNGYLYNVYISDAQTANDLVELQRNHIYALLTFGQNNDPSKYTLLKGGYLCLPLEDSSYDLLPIMDKVTKFINIYIPKGNILVHCCKGNSRACAAVIGWLIKTFKIPFENAFNIIKEGRPSISLSYIFERQLKRIERAELYN
jgi:protein-tyrosine phosphatase